MRHILVTILCATCILAALYTSNTVLVAATTSTTTTSLRGVHPSRNAAYPASASSSSSSSSSHSATFQCLDGSKTIPLKQVNDDYCDCTDGSDEPGTSACSMIVQQNAATTANDHLQVSPYARFYCQNIGYQGRLIYASRVNDGVCDCCDGSDEFDGRVACVNTCQQLGQEIRQQYSGQISNIQQGLRVKLSYTQQNQMEAVERKQKITQLQTQLQELSQRAEQLKARKDELEAADKAAQEAANAALAAATATASAAETSSSEAAASSSPDASTTESATTLTESASEPSASHFPYPAEYAAPSPTPSPAPAPSPSSFPYPAEYAAPSAAAFAPTEPEQAVEDEETNLTPEQAASILASAVNPPASEASHENIHDVTAAAQEAVSTSSGMPVKLASLLDSVKNFFTQKLGSGPSSSTPDDTSAPTLQQLNSAREEYRVAQNKRDDVDRELKELEKLASLDFGPHGEFTSLYKKCFSTGVRQYTYEVCLFDRAAQKEGYSSTSLGTWNAWKSEDNYLKMRFENGQTCWNGPSRSMEVTFVCGSDNTLQGVDEPSKCTYTASFHTPAVCKQEDVDKLLNELKQLTGEDIANSASVLKEEL